MTTFDARRIVHFKDDFDMSWSRLAQQLGCSESEARLEYMKAKSTVNLADVRAAVAKLNELATTFNTSAADLVALYS